MEFALRRAFNQAPLEQYGGVFVDSFDIARGRTAPRPGAMERIDGLRAAEKRSELDRARTRAPGDNHRFALRSLPLRTMTEQPGLSLDDIEWRWKPFSDLTATEVYDILGARNEVFVVEQNCVYGDVDGFDKSAWHLIAYGHGSSKLGGYLRVLLPDADDPDLRIGRVLTTAQFRGIGLGNAMLARAMQHIANQWPGVPIRLHAQAHLQKFYGAFGFGPISEVHEEDGIAHVWMRSS